MRILLALLVIAGVASASNLRGDESRELQTYIYGSDSTRRTGDALFIIEDDNSRSTAECAEDTADEFEDEFDDIIFAADDDDARNGDIVAVIDENTDCDRLWDDIYAERDDRHDTSTVYVYYGSGSRYYTNKGGRGYRLYYGRKWGRNYRKSRKGDKNKNRWWYGYHHNHRNWDDWDDKNDWHHKDEDNDKSGKDNDEDEIILFDDEEYLGPQDP